ncbi:MAG: response regulator [Vicinamibacterales bacterium]
MALSASQARVRELEVLCAEVYVAAVQLGLPQALLNRVWTIAARGQAPQFGVDPPTDGEAAAIEQRVVGPSPPSPNPLPVPDLGRLGPELAAAGGADLGRTPLEPLVERRTLLLVDDDPLMLAVMKGILQRENFDLLLAGSGQEALDLLDGRGEAPLDMLVVDVEMPGMKGPALVEKLASRYPDLPVLFQTGFSDLLFHDRMELGERQAFLEKPFSARGLREAVRFLLLGSVNPVEGPQ